mmetsp:Transcript_30126/g.84145  ORF Transcript_30126/g.84145 Transcript_30126/m.84145 type:complete len:233 (+) Transcript_30126:588-1286(+)
MMSGRFVAPIMNTCFLPSMPSISVRIWFTTRSPAPPASPACDPREDAIESNSSKNSTHGAAARALSNSSRTFDSDSPNHMVKSSGPLMEMKFDWHSLAMALARRVFPHPGGPNNSTPLDGSMPNLRYNWGYNWGYMTVSINSLRTSSSPPISFQVTFGTSTAFSLSADGLEILRACRKCSFVMAMESRIFASIVSASRSIRSIFSRIHCSAASVHSAAKSAPTWPCVSWAIR